MIARVYDGVAGNQTMGVLFVYPKGEPWSGAPAESWTWGGDHWNHYELAERKMAADLLRLWRRFGFSIRRKLLA